MPHKNFYYRLNNFLILLVIIFVGFLLYSKFQVAHSQTPTTNPDGSIPNVSTPAYVIERELQVSVSPGSYTAHFVSDGYTGKPSDEQKAKFFKKADGSAADLALIETPLSFEIDPAGTKAILPGTLVYPLIPKNTAPSNYQCVDKGSTGDTVENRRNCFFGVTQLSVFTDSTTQNIVLGDQQYSISTATNDYFVNFSDTLRTALNNLRNQIVKSTGLPDQSREAIGTIRFWGDDAYQQFVPITGGNQTRRPILYAKASADTAANNVDSGLFASGFSPGLDAQISTRYKEANVVNVVLCPSSVDPNASILEFYKSNPICGPGQILEPFTSIGSDPKPQSSSAVALVEIADAFLQVVTQNNPIFQQKQQRLSAQVALRPIEESTKFSLKYAFCDATKAQGINYGSYPNPIRKETSTTFNIITRLPETKTVCKAKNPTSGVDEEVDCKLYDNYNGLGSNVKECIANVEKYTKPETAYTCAYSMAKDPSIGCDEFSVEESGFNLSQMETSFPLGLGSYFQNSSLQELDPANTKGPYINYMSPYFCGKLNLAYKLKGGEPYIYDAGTVNGNSGKVRDANNKFIEANFVNQYCILGGVFSVFSYATTLMANNNYNTENFNGVINLPKEALTCDKKETVYFGAVPIKSNVDNPAGKPIYITDDNTREANQTKDEVVIYHGYNAYPLTDILKDPIVQGKGLIKYGSLDMQVVINPSTKEPKYVVLTILFNKAKSDDKGKALMLCKFPSDQVKYSEKSEKSLCKEIIRGGFIFPNSVGMVHNEIKLKNGKTKIIDTITVTYRQPQPTDSKGDWPMAYQFIDVLDDFDIAKSVVSGSFTFNQNYTTNVDTVQLAGGQLAAAGITKSEHSIDKIGASIIDPYEGEKAVFEQNEKGDDIVNVKRQPNEREISGNMCTSTDYCKILNSLAYDNTVRIVTDPNTGLVHFISIARGFGVIFSASTTGGSAPGPQVFGFKYNTKRFSDDYDDISAVKLKGTGEFEMFLGRSGYYLNVFAPEMGKNSQVLENVKKLCGTNCYLTVQKEFNPSNFTNDCTGYDGEAVCGYPKLNEIGAPIVSSFIYEPNGRIRAWYTQKGLDKTLMQSPDMLYAYSPVYENVKDNTGPSNEFSDVYIPVAGEVQLDAKKKISGPVGTPIRYFNYASGGLRIGRELEDSNGNIRENIFANTDSLPGYDRARISEKLDCINRLNNLVSGIDLYYTNTGLTPVNVNPASQTSSPISPISSSPNGSQSSTNPGEFCEEKWCIADNFALANNPQFKNDRNDATRKAKIVEFLSRGNASLKAEYTRRVDYMCSVSDEFGEPCSLLAAIWWQESGGRLISTPFNCFNGTTSFEDQVRCAAVTVFNRNAEYQNGTKTISGPSDRVGKPYLTNEQRGGGKCTAATAFSYVFNKYTPLDKRINNDNQCNRSLVTRTGKDQDLYCRSNTPLPNEASRDANGVSSLPAVWGDATSTRNDLQNALISIGEDRLGDPRNSLCYPATQGTGIPSNPTNNADIQAVLNQYDTSKTQTVGSMKINLANWGTDDAAGNIFMLLNVNTRQAQSDYNAASATDKANFTIDKYADGKGFQGAYVIPPGQSWSLNDSTGNLSGDFVEKYIVPKIKSTKAPWNSGNFNYDPAYRCITKNKDGSVEINVGCGWCEMGTSIRLASERVKATDGKLLAQDKFSGASAVGADTTYGTGGGWKNDINHWSHSGVSINTFNALVPNGETGLTDVTKYVAVVTRPGASNGLNDGDLIIKNPYTDGSIDMILTIQQGSDGIVTIQVYFGTKK